jgi:hypothetical protein
MGIRTASAGTDRSCSAGTIVELNWWAGARPLQVGSVTAADDADGADANAGFRSGNLTPRLLRRQRTAENGGKPDDGCFLAYLWLTIDAQRPAIIRRITCEVAERAMVRRVIMKSHPALKHGGYSVTGLLPGEDPVAFEKLHRALISEYAPSGPLEEDVVATIARLMWRKQNFGTFMIARLARKRWSEIYSERRPDRFVLSRIPSSMPPRTIHEMVLSEKMDPEEVQAAEDQLRAELGEHYELIELGDPAALNQELELLEKLQSMIDKQLKTLLLARGLKSISTVPISAPHPRRIPRSQDAA